MGQPIITSQADQLSFSFSRVARQTVTAILFVALLATYTANNSSNASTTAPAPAVTSQTQPK